MTDVLSPLSPATSEPGPPVARSHWLAAAWREACADRRVTVFAFALPVLLFAVELTHYTLSMDENTMQFAPSPPRLWAEQGRWGMALLTAVTPPISSIPLLAPALFCVGLSVSALLLSSLVATSRLESFVFIGFFAASAVWPNLVEFNTLSWGIGVALVALAVALHALATITPSRVAVAVVLLAVALGVYQTVFLLVIPMVVAVHLRSPMFLAAPTADQGAPTAAPTAPGTGHRSAFGGRMERTLLLVLINAVTLDLLVQMVVLRVLGAHLTYVEQYLRIGQFLDPGLRAAAVRNSLESVAELLGLAGTVYGGWGPAFLLLPWIGALAGPVAVFARRGLGARQRVRGVVALGVVAGCLVVPATVAAGSFPARSMLALPSLAALWALNAVRIWPRPHVLWRVLLAVTVYVSCWHTATLFMADQVARERDAVMAARVMDRIDALRPAGVTGPVPFAAFGTWTFEHSGTARASGYFGSSLFDLRYSNLPSLAAYLRIEGERGLDPVELSTLRPQAAQLEAMPAWPAPGSVARVNGVIVLRLGPLSRPEAEALGS